MSIIKQEYGSFTDVETQQMLAPILYSLIANRDFAIGDLFIFQNKLYKAIKAISTTDPIVIGDGTDPSDNATAASTVSEELQGMTKVAEITTTTTQTFKQALNAMANACGSVLPSIFNDHANTVILKFGSANFVGHFMLYDGGLATFECTYGSTGIYFNLFKLATNGTDSGAYRSTNGATPVDVSATTLGASQAGTWAIYY